MRQAGAFELSGFKVSAQLTPKIDQDSFCTSSARKLKKPSLSHFNFIEVRQAGFLSFPASKSMIASVPPLTLQCWAKVGTETIHDT